MSTYLHLPICSTLRGTVHRLSASKSISNRVLILKALSGNQAVVRNLSDARDTQLMMQALVNPEKVIDVKDAGTTMRFLTAFFSLTGQHKEITGTPRMKERPIGLLVDALRKLGATINYLEKEGFPPIETQGFANQATAELEIAGDVSSQYISALMMTGALLPKGLVITLTGKMGSVPYIEMTAALMHEFGVDCQTDWKRNTISIPNQQYRPAQYTVEADWSSASYWFAFTALAKQAEIILPNVTVRSLQGDKVIMDIMAQLGVQSDFSGTSLRLTKTENANYLSWDFKDCPDLAQTVLPVCAAKGINGEFTGLESLRIKETDRITALQNELGKIGAKLTEPVVGRWRLEVGGSMLEKHSNIRHPASSIQINTYHDHRMAMGFAPWATLFDLKIESPDVVDKSYPGFWKDMKEIGFDLSII
ncbi:MAG: 3-phosphoshikimate 1-carboxyvinyltransferase [Cytophagales bacterium]